MSRVMPSLSFYRRLRSLHNSNKSKIIIRLYLIHSNQIRISHSMTLLIFKISCWGIWNLERENWHKKYLRRLVYQMRIWMTIRSKTKTIVFKGWIKVEDSHPMCLIKCKEETHHKRRSQATYHTKIKLILTPLQSTVAT